jgi:MoaA/NifB/PqqE/SkfB family radical SAM enzyme
MYKEWNSPFNPFNSMKILLWSEQLEGIVKEDFLAPVSVNTDPTNCCNYNCIWCIASEILNKKQNTLSLDHLIKLADFYAEWGVYSTCVAGGGEPLLNKATPLFLERLKSNGVQASLITNGSLLTPESIDVVARTCTWVGISMDAGEDETYQKVKGIKSEGMFSKVILNISNLVTRIKDSNSNCRIGYKFLLHPINCKEILKAAKLAKSIGVTDFHCRPLAWDNIVKAQGIERPDLTPYLDIINSQIQNALELEDDNFHFFGIRHKFQDNFERKVNFSRCRASPLSLTFGGDGACYLCCDLRGREDVKLCDHYPNPHNILKYWNSNIHKRMIDNIIVEKCPRCTFGIYNEIIEKVFLKDDMCRYFP